MWFLLLSVSNTLICGQVSVYASPPELVEQVYMSITTSPVLWTRRESNPPRSPCKGVPPALEHASPKNTHLTFNSTFTTNYRMSLRVLVNHYLRKIIWYISGGDYEIRTPPKSCKDFGYHYIIIPINLKNFWRAFPHC